MTRTRDGLTPAQRRKERFRHRIMEVAAELYIENGGEDGGYERTTVEAIAERADMSVRSFFRYFSTKADVIYLDTERATEDLLKFVRDRLEVEPPIKAVLDGSLDQIRWFLSDPINRDRFRRSIAAPQFRERLAIWRDQERRQVAELLREHAGDDKLTAESCWTIAATIRALVAAALESWRLVPDEDPEEIVLRSLTVLQGIAEEAAQLKLKPS